MGSDADTGVHRDAQPNLVFHRPGDAWIEVEEFVVTPIFDREQAGPPPETYIG